MNREAVRNVLLDNATLAHAGGPYVAFMHPSGWRYIQEYGPRAKWRHAWRRYRVARRELVCGYLPPRTILDRFAPPNESLRRGEVGRFEGFRVRLP